MKWFDFFRKKKAVVQGKGDATKHKALSPETVAYRLQVRASAMPCVRIEATPADHLFLFDSKFGGLPYWPAAKRYPTDGNGKPMALLAQLNFSQIPALAGYPDKGLLQFYLADHDLYGVNFDKPTDQTNFRVVYFEDTLQTPLEDFRFLTATPRESALPVEGQMQLQFSLQTNYVGSEDVRYNKLVNEDLLATDAELEAADPSDAFLDEIDNGGHKIGGYAFFTQWDPREGEEEYEGWILLLQIDSQFNEILWGDMGVGNFFIHPDALARRDFSNVLYYWDCT